ncbi:winged helix-turn-helix transcriptional regulator [Candidatus Woesearchaeota archaeon]|nr:winged helix-turn-helix transcriptional regulator [Candidatus Woesearchaeota archaeon]
MKHIVIALVSDNLDPIFLGLKEFLTERIILITSSKDYKIAEKAKGELEKFKIDVQIREINDNLWENIFKIISQIKNQEGGPEKLILNVASGKDPLKCAAISAAFVNGIKAFDVDENKPMLLPILKFSYYNILTDKKMKILQLLSEPNCCKSLEEISNKTKMSLPLISYHINGTKKSEGLKQLGLVDREEKGSRVEIKLTTLGRLLLNGYISS